MLGGCYKYAGQNIHQLMSTRWCILNPMWLDEQHTPLCPCQGMRSPNHHQEPFPLVERSSTLRSRPGMDIRTVYLVIKQRCSVLQEPCASSSYFYGTRGRIRWLLSTTDTVHVCLYLCMTFSMPDMVTIHKSIASNTITFGNLPKSTAGLTLRGSPGAETNPFSMPIVMKRDLFLIL